MPVILEYLLVKVALMKVQLFDWLIFTLYKLCIEIVIAGKRCFNSFPGVHPKRKDFIIGFSIDFLFRSKVLC